MVHRLSRQTYESTPAAVREARLHHGAITGLDAEAYLEMCRGVFSDTFRPYTRLLPSLLRGAGWPEGAIVDVGCGPGVLAGLLLDNDPGSRVVGVDVSTDALTLAARENSRHLQAGRFTLVHEDVSRSFSADEAVLVTMKHTAHHLPDLADALARIHGGMASPSLLLIHDHRRDGSTDTVIPFVQGLYSIPTDPFGLYSRILGYVDSRRVAYLASEVVAALEQTELRTIAVMESADELVVLAGKDVSEEHDDHLRDALLDAFALTGFTLSEEVCP